ncbi:hypothetical protein AUJ94_02015 [bacterium CG2_30_40_12]|nr:MAG: hypothetical protein AUJ94_02015 [bacterium CG2_30_40_12]
MVLMQAIVLGIVQGLTEFLPVSSSAHLILVPKLFNWQEHTLFFDTALHLGTACAVIVYFAKDWLRIVKNKNYVLKVLIGIFPAGILGFLFSDFIEVETRSISIISITLIAGTAVMLFSEKIFKQATSLKTNVSIRDSLFIGVMQMLAILPGMSRSGMTISGGFLRKIKKDEAVKFSFYLATPIIFGAAIYSFIKSFKNFGGLGFLESSFAVGFITSFVIGLLTIRFMIEYIRKRGFRIFLIYRLLLALFICLKSYPNT